MAEWLSSLRLRIRAILRQRQLEQDLLRAFTPQGTLVPDGPQPATSLTQLAASLLYQTNAYDLVTFATVSAVLAAAGLLACALPAWRAGRVEPATALRADS